MIGNAVITSIGIVGAFLALFVKELDDRPKLKRVIAVSSLALLLGTTIFTLIVSQPADPYAICKAYGLHITRATDPLLTRTGVMTVTGTYVTEPPPRTVKLLVTSSNQFWPAPDYVVFNPNNTWTSQVYGAADYFASVAVIDTRGKVLADYFERVGQSNQRYIGIIGEPDQVGIIPCDMVKVAVRP